MDFGIGMTSAYGRTVISVSGELDALSVKPFASTLSAANESRDAEVHLDLSNVSLISRECVDCLIDAHTALAAAGQQLQLVQASREVVDALVGAGAWERFA